jgi:hypothetical protein
MMTQDEWATRMEARLAALEQLAQHCSDPEDREIDNALRRVLKTAISVAWLVKNLTLFAGIIIGGKLAMDQITAWFR